MEIDSEDQFGQQRSVPTALRSGGKERPGFEHLYHSSHNSDVREEESNAEDTIIVDRSQHHQDQEEEEDEEDKLLYPEINLDDPKQFDQEVLPPHIQKQIWIRPNSKPFPKPPAGLARRKLPQYIEDCKTERKEWERRLRLDFGNRKLTHRYGAAFCAEIALRNEGRWEWCIVKEIGEENEKVPYGLGTWFL